MLTLNEITSKLEKLNNWILDGSSIIKQVDFPSLKEVAAYLGKLAEIPVLSEHSPDILIIKNSVRLTLPSAIDKELSENDFKIAEEIDKISL